MPPIYIPHPQPPPLPLQDPKLGAPPPPPLAPAHLAWWSAPALRELCGWVNWAGETGRCEGRQSFQTLDEILSRTPADPSDPAPEAAMPRRTWDTLPRDAVQGLCRPYIPEILRRWVQTTHCQAWANGAPEASPRPHHQHTKKAKGKRKGLQQEGKERPKVTGTRPEGQGTGENTRWGKEPPEDHQHWEKKRAGTT